jgi:hypothetical protein
MQHLHRKLSPIFEPIRFPLYAWVQKCVLLSGTQRLAFFDPHLARRPP